MNVLNYKLYYFLGIGGIGMSALARFFNHYSKKVMGYDKTSTRLTDELQSEGISCHFTESSTDLKKIFQGFKKEEILVIYTPAVGEENEELKFIRSENFMLLKRAQVLGEITKSFRTLAVAGTHGKTTTTTLVTHILKTAGLNCFAFMGGISRNYNTNLLLGEVSAGETFVVVEADEYDRSFLTLHPEIAIITSADADHLDIYGDDKHVKEGYTLFARQVNKDGMLIVKKNVDNDLRLTGKRIIYSLNLDTDYCARKIKVENGEFIYDIESPVESITHVTLGIPGLHNVENSIAAVAMAQQLGIKGEVIREALRSFKGVKRRFDYRVKSGKVIYIDDYAHHPEELKATIGSVRQLYPGKKVTGIFQPHLFSRTRDFADGFAESLDMLDECILLEIYPAREKPIKGIDSEMLLGKMKIANKCVMSKEQVLEEIEKGGKEVIVTMGAGDIDSLVQPIENILKKQT
jgi:UDP-N-acetylmuramate--alanine ligase